METIKAERQNWKLWLLLAFAFVGAATNWWHKRQPGGTLNPHLWMSEYCLKYDPKLSGYSVIQIELANGETHTHECWEVDFCIRHGESRVMPCSSPRSDSGE